jgi:peptidyl-prolyl cis-trans isomerase SurA
MLKSKTIVILLAAATVVAASLMPLRPANAQVVVVVNGLPITELDIAQRSKLMASMERKPVPRQEVINALIDDRIKIAKAKFYGFEIPESDVDTAFENMAKRQGASVAQFGQVLDRAGISVSGFKSRLKAELTWQQLIRGKFSSSLQVGETDVALALRSRGEDTKDDVGFVYTLYPVMVIVPSGSSETVIDAKRREADNLRNRFASCDEGLKLARAVRDIAVREPITRSSADLSPQLRTLLGSMEIGRLTTPDVTPQGLQMFALCDKKQSNTDSPAKKEMRDQIFSKRFEAESKKYLEELRKQAMIEYK